MSSVIKVENLSKAYQLGEFGTGTLSRDIERFWAKMRGKEDPFLKVGEANDRATKGKSDIVWSLSDINFTVEQGDTVGIIGRNGAGKSTLLKILSRVTAPTGGSVKIKGRVASLLEVGTGFHPELTGRENIFLNGAILGMRKTEIKRRFDEIVDFAGVERYIDTPVKRYSSGMYVRLAFGVAAHLESEILVVDEVLAVGDAEFQKKCLGKMNDVSKGEGRTVLFVSHNMTAVKSLCKSGMLLERGSLSYTGLAEQAINKYLMAFSPASKQVFESDNILSGNKLVALNSIEAITGNPDGRFLIDKELAISVSFKNKTVTSPINVNLFFNTLDGVNIFATCSASYNLPQTDVVLKCLIPANILNDNIYSIDVMIVTNSEALLTVRETLLIEGIEPPRPGGWLDKFPGLVRPEFVWSVEK
jgi:lipopolysaccharide transport system ATP-binding protein